MSKLTTLDAWILERCTAALAYVPSSDPGEREYDQDLSQQYENALVQIYNELQDRARR